MRTIVLAALFCGAALGAFAEFADHAYLPPAAAKADDADAARFPLPRAAAAELLDAPMPRHEFARLAGRGAALKAAAADSFPARVAENSPVNLFASALFDAPVKQDGAVRWCAALSSPGAEALRLRVDLSGLSEGQRLWLLDASGERTFGPYEKGAAPRWLPVTLGDTAVLAAESRNGAMPPVMVEALSHFFVSLAGKAEELPCPIPADCETNPAAREVSTAVALIIVPQDGGQVLCSGTLLNRAGAPDYAPLFITAHHCFEDGGVSAEEVDAFWDYRSGSCGAATPDIAWNTLPRSAGTSLIAHSSRLDAQFLRLDGAPVGVYGRAWAGWDTRPVAVGDAVQGFHCPRGLPMKTCRGSVINTGATQCVDLICSERYELQNEVRWAEGITEAGSSGSGLFFPAVNYRLGGVLSNGTTHVCGSPENNRDNYSSFADFFPQIACHLVDGMECAEGDDTGCLVNKSLGGRHPVTKLFRAVRDNLLAASPEGREFIQKYYEWSSRLTRP